MPALGTHVLSYTRATCPAYPNILGFTTLEALRNLSHDIPRLEAHRGSSRQGSPNVRYRVHKSPPPVLNRAT
jgi:hypothetical protein